MNLLHNLMHFVFISNIVDLPKHHKHPEQHETVDRAKKIVVTIHAYSSFSDPSLHSI